MKNTLIPSHHNISIQFITILYIIPVGKWMPSTTASSMAQLIMVPDSSYLDPPTAKAHVILQPFAATRLLVLVGEPAGKRSDFLQSLKMCRSCLSPFRVPQLEMVFLPEAALPPTYSIPQCFREAQLPFPEPCFIEIDQKCKVAATYNNSGPSVYLDALEIRNSPGQSISVFFLCHPLLCPSARPRRMH